jgi:hypothetical protein
VTSWGKDSEKSTAIRSAAITDHPAFSSVFLWPLLRASSCMAASSAIRQTYLPSSTLQVNLRPDLHCAIYDLAFQVLILRPVQRSQTSRRYAGRLPTTLSISSFAWPRSKSSITPRSPHDMKRDLKSPCLGQALSGWRESAGRNFNSGR